MEMNDVKQRLVALILYLDTSIVDTVIEETIQVYYFHHIIHSYRLFPILLVSLSYHVVNEVVKVGICRKGRKVRTLGTK